MKTLASARRNRENRRGNDEKRRAGTRHPHRAAPSRENGPRLPGALRRAPPVNAAPFPGAHGEASACWKNHGNAAPGAPSPNSALRNFLKDIFLFAAENHRWTRIDTDKKPFLAYRNFIYKIIFGAHRREKRHSCRFHVTPLRKKTFRSRERIPGAPSPSSALRNSRLKIFFRRPRSGRTKANRRATTRSVASCGNVMKEPRLRRRRTSRERDTFPGVNNEQ